MVHCCCFKFSLQQKLGLKALVDGFMSKITRAFHLDDFLEHIEKIFHLDQFGGSVKSMSDCSNKAAQVHQVLVYI